MRIAQVALTPLRLELHQPLKTSRGTYAAREGFLVRLVDEDGRVGWGEAMPLPEFGTEPLAACGEALSAWLSALCGQSLEDSVRAIEDTLARGILARSGTPEVPLPGREGVRSRARQGPAAGPLPAAEHALELALLDLLAERQGGSLCGALA